MRPRSSLLFYLKNKIFLGKKLVRLAPTADAPPLAFRASKPTAWAGRGPHPAPRLALYFQKTAEIFRGRKAIYFTPKSVLTLFRFIAIYFAINVITAPTKAIINPAKIESLFLSQNDRSLSPK